MDRIFHQRFTLAAKCGIMVFTLMAFYMLWMQKALAGIVLMLIVVVMIERVIHTVYIFHGSDLIIDRGRFSRRQIISLPTVTAVRCVPTALRLGHVLTIEHDDGRLTAVQPEDDDRFTEEMKKRIKNEK